MANQPTELEKKQFQIQFLKGKLTATEKRLKEAKQPVITYENLSI